MADRLTVGGGAGSTAAVLADLFVAAGLLARAADELREIAAAVAGTATASEVLDAALLCPVEGAIAEARLAAAGLAPTGIGPIAVGAELLAQGIRLSVLTYQVADETAQRELAACRWQAGVLFGELWGPSMLVAAAPAVTGLTALDRLTGGAAGQALRREGGAALSAELYDHPGLTEALVAQGPSAVQGMTAGMLGPLLPPSLRPLLTAAPTGDGFQSLLLELELVGLVPGRLSDTGTFTVRPVAREDERGVVPPAGNVADLLDEERLLGQDGHEGLLTVRQVRHADGPTSWVVQIPGTQDWSTERGSNPVDLTTDVHLMAGQHTRLAELVGQALHDSGAAPTDHVMLAGHSLGGIAAAALASDPQFADRFTVTAVVTAGAPIARFAIPARVAVLSLEHDQDVVPMLDGRRNPATASWVTVRRDLAGESGESGAPPAAGFPQAHASSTYLRTAELVDRSDDVAVAHWRDRAAEFFDTSDQRGVRFRIEPSPDGTP